MSIIQAFIGAIVSSSSGGGGSGYQGAPGPGTGSYNNYWSGSEGWSAQGTPFDPGGGISAIDNPTWGWRRTTAQGYWSNNGNNDNPGIFNAGYDATYDNYGGFGTTSLSDFYACEWKGYIRAPSTGSFNFLLDSDDVAMFWIGTAALNPDSNQPLLTTNNGSQLNSNSVSLTSNIWYPIRMRYQEWSGNERCQIYFGPAGSSNPVYAMNNWQDYMGWNINTLGY